MSSCSTVVGVINLHSVNPGFIPAVTHKSCVASRKVLAKLLLQARKSPTFYVNMSESDTEYGNDSDSSRGLSFIF